MTNMITETVPWLKDSSATSATTKNNKSVLGKDDFLKLLVAQLQYQDPLEPMKDTEFISQMANFSSLEQMNNLNASFDKLAANISDFLIPTLMIQQSTNLIGREISYQNPDTDVADLLTGIVSSVVFKNGTAYCVIDGKEIDMKYLSGIGKAAPAQNDKLDQLVEQLDDLLSLIVVEDGETDE